MGVVTLAYGRGANPTLPEDGPVKNKCVDFLKISSLDSGPETKKMKFFPIPPPVALVWELGVKRAGGFFDNTILRKGNREKSDFGTTSYAIDTRNLTQDRKGFLSNLTVFFENQRFLSLSNVLESPALVGVLDWAGPPAIFGISPKAFIFRLF